ncbi:MAG: bifunctional folylpolyglutamate synthase/dihydrofolate synthase [Lachnospiraceae bacterium]|nr:bifunctional folylpolyglutamate synthase/dihydrofolate synthase [Lachnospiraceae bacterium]
MTYQEAEQYLLSIPKFTTKNSLENTRTFISLLGARIFTGDTTKSQDFTKTNHVIHVAGTNGKGSVCAYINQILTEAGYRCGMFISPHLISMTERFQINGIPICEHVFADVCTRVKEQADRGVAAGEYSHPTFFEFLTGMAFLIFAEAEVDYIILETGLGGTLDATNIIEQPRLCVITSIGYDHTEYLGETLEEIAGEKAGIIKQGVPVVYDGRNEEISVIIEQKAREMCSKTYEVTMKNCEKIIFGKKTIDFLLQNEYYNNMRIHLETSADYQIINAALAAVAIQTLDIKPQIPKEQVAAALGNTQWPGRMEWLSEHFLVDGAHNENGIEQAVQTITRSNEPVVLLYTAVRDKNYRKIIEWICLKIKLSAVVVTQLDIPRAAQAEELCSIFQEFYSGPVFVEKQIEKAIRKAEEIRSSGIIFGTGSLYLIGEIRKFVFD